MMSGIKFTKHTYCHSAASLAFMVYFQVKREQFKIYIPIYLSIHTEGNSRLLAEVVLMVVTLTIIVTFLYRVPCFQIFHNKHVMLGVIKVNIHDHL